MKRPLGVFAEHPHTPAFDPFERVFFPGGGHAGFAKLTETANAALRISLRGELHGRQPHGSVEPLGVGDVRPELFGRGFQLKRPIVLVNLVRIALGQAGMGGNAGRLAAERALQVAEHRRGVGVAGFRRLGQGLFDDLTDAVADFRVELLKRRRRLVAMLGQDNHWIVAQERRPASQQVK